MTDPDDDSPPTEMDSTTSGDEDGDEDSYGFLKRAQEEEQSAAAAREDRLESAARAATREARLAAAQAAYRQETNAHERPREPSRTPRRSAASSSYTVRFNRNLNTVSAQDHMSSPWILAMRAFARTELPDYGRLKDLKEKWPSYDWTRLMPEPWITIQDSHKKCELAAVFQTYKKFKIGITRCPFTRWFRRDCGLEKQWQHMFAYPCADEHESAGLETHYIAKYTGDHRLMCNTEGGEGKSPASPHFLYFAVRN